MTDWKLSRIILAISIFFNFLSCRKVDENGFKRYVIKEGNHRSTYAYHTTRDTVFNWSIIFDSSAIYNTLDSLNQYDINKYDGKNIVVLIPCYKE